MADINDFKVLKNKCVKMYDYFGNGEFSDANDKARMGFYHLVLENIAGINEVNAVQNCIIDTEYNRAILKIDTDDLGIDAVCYKDEYIDGEKPKDNKKRIHYIRKSSNSAEPSDDEEKDPKYSYYRESCKAS